MIRMDWHDLLFAHWPVDAALMRRWIPQALEIESFGGQAWIGVVPFHMSGIRRRWTPRMPTTHTFVELNVRTYVTDGRKPGVWFFSLDASSRLAVWAARRWYYLNYVRARMSVSREWDGWINYASNRFGSPVEFAGRYRGMDEPFVAEAGSLEDWLTARYCLYAADGRGRVYRGDIEHEPWRLQRAEANIQTNTMAQPLGIELRGQPHLLYARKISTIARPLVRIDQPAV